MRAAAPPEIGQAVIAAHGLRKTYGKLVAVKQVDLDIQSGEVFGILGPNGVGKTTTLEMVEGLRKPDSGTIVVGDISTLILFALLGGRAFLTIGFAISGLARTGEAANALGNVVTMPMMFLSGVYFPISGAPAWLKPLIGVLPLTYLANGMRDIVLREVGAGGLGTDMLVRVITSVLGCGVAARTFRWE